MSLSAIWISISFLIFSSSVSVSLSSAALFSLDSFLKNETNSNFSNNSFFFSLSSLKVRSSILLSTGTSVKIVASFLLNIASSLPSVNLSFNFLPLILSIFSSTFSTFSYWVNSFIAVFSPTPGIPGM